MDIQQRSLWPGSPAMAAAVVLVSVLALLAAGPPAIAQGGTAAAAPVVPAAAPASALAAPAALQIKPVVSINVLMVKFVDQAADAIWTAAVRAPKNQCEWEQVEYRATQLATTGTLLKIGGTGPKDMQWRNSAGWAAFADNMTGFALQAARAAASKDMPTLSAVGDKLILNCEACHRAFKPELPTQGIATHLAHTSPSAEGLISTCK
jgi:hypothetical protein